MLLSALILVPFFSVIFIFLYNFYNLKEKLNILKIFALFVTIIDLLISLII